MVTPKSSQNMCVIMFITRISDTAAISMAFVNYDRKVFSAQCKNITQANSP